MADNFAMIIVCLSGYDSMSMWVVVCVCWLTTDAPNVGFPVFLDPSVYMKLSGFHVARNGLSGRCGGRCVGSSMSGYGYV